MMKILAIVLVLGAGSVAAEEGKIDFKKTEKGAGELFRGMGQEIQRSGILGGKKDEKKEAKKAAGKKEAKKDKGSSEEAAKP
jgi:hypothetical protein